MRPFLQRAVGAVRASPGLSLAVLVVSLVFGGVLLSAALTGAIGAPGPAIRPPSCSRALC